MRWGVGGASGTFDNSVNTLLGFSDSVYQDIGHFAVGKLIEDSRLVTFPPYHHLKKRKKGASSARRCALHS